jgi:hypothetical protein
MPELTWTTALAWFGVLTGAASVVGLLVALVGNRTITAMHRETLTVLDRIDARAEARYRDLKDAIEGGSDAS